tara:strand:- start:12082 stop:12249 length:168 start_codon:yes stop_codon:yes gene_type:complete
MDISKEDFNAFVTIQTSGAYNMFDPRARAATGLSKDKFFKIIKEYDELEDKYGSR